MSGEGARFHQSLSDFPLMVSLDKKLPSFGLHRFKQGLRFVPSGDEGFALRGDRRRLLYKGRRQSHRFTVLGDTSFEYDCILNKEPDTNVIALLIEGAEYYDFFKQPDFVKDSFLRGSYAVYKKNTLIGEGTGKLCHIHRPMIIDALGRRVWGELSVGGNELRITIPERWLAAAKYPVVVDPTVGTSTIGTYKSWLNPNTHNYEYLLIHNAIAVNRYVLPETLRETARAYVYTDYYDYGVLCKPVIYSDNNNTPLARLSTNESNIDIALTNTNRFGWRNTEFGINANTASGSYIWFGVMCDKYYPRYDYGNNCYMESYIGNTVPDTYPLVNANNYYDLKLTMYCDYSPYLSFKRTLTQGVLLSGSPEITAAYRRNLTQTAEAHSLLSGFAAFTRSIQETVQAIDVQKTSVLFVRSLSETLHVNGMASHWGEYYRGLMEQIQADGEVKAGKYYLTKIIDKVFTVGTVIRGLTIFVRIITHVFARDYLLGRFLVAREELVLKSSICREINLESKID